MSDLREALKRISTFDPTEVQKTAKVCVIREIINDLLYNVEPIDSTSFNTNPVIDMTSDELDESKKNWIYRVRMSSVSDTSKIGDSTGIFQLPKIDSTVIVEWLNDEDAYISLTSDIDEVILKSDETVVRLAKEEWSVQITAKDVELLIREIIKLRNGRNELQIGAGEDGVRITYDAIANASFTINGVSATGGRLSTFEIDNLGKFIMKNAFTDFKSDVLDELQDMVTTLTKSLTDLSALFKAFLPTNPVTGAEIIKLAPPIDIALDTSFRSRLGKLESNIDDLFK